MAIIKWTPWDPFEEFDRFFGDFPALSGRFGNFVPAVDMYRDGDAIVVESSLSGFKPEEVEVSVENGILTLKGEHTHKREVEEKDYYRKEMRSGSFFRQVALPAGVKEDAVKAVFKDGVLRVTAPVEKKQLPAGRKVQIEKK